MRRQGILIRRIFLHVEDDDFLPLGRHNTTSATGQLERIVTAAAILGCVHHLAGDDAVARRQELLGLAAAGSAAAVVQPIDGFGHTASS